jgi:hypothetical protein
MARVCRNCGFLNEQLEIDAHPLIPGDVSDDPWQQLADLDSSITHMQSLLFQLEHKRAGIKREINARVSPILKFPPELFSEIFLTYLANSVHKWDFLMSYDHLSISRMPLLFGRICKAWRDHAWSIPQLWNSVQVTLRSNMDPDLVDQWLIRSGTLPLSICIVIDIIGEFASSPSDLDLQVVVAILDIIGQHTERWRHVAFDLPQYCYDELTRIKHRLLNLESIFIQSPASLERVHELDSDLFADAPQLREAHLKIMDPHHFTFATTQLTTLSLERSPINDCFDILRRSPRVTHCSFKVIWPTSNLHLILTPILTPHLESLELGFASMFSDVTQVFNCLTIPAIQTFICRSDGFRFPHLSFMSLMSQSACTLQELCLNNWQISSNDLIECLRAAPSIHTLSLTRLTGPSDP